MAKYMIVHQKDPQFVSRHINSACKVCAGEKEASWKRVYYNLKEGRIFCEWEAPDRGTLERVLEKKLYLPCEEIVEVEEMTSQDCRWEIFGELPG